MKHENSFRKKMGKLKLFLLPYMLAAGFTSYAQDNIWTGKTETVSMKAAERQIVPQNYFTAAADIVTLKQVLAEAPLESAAINAKTSAKSIVIPMPDGSMKRFSLIESPIMQPGLAARFPEIKTYLGQGIDDPSASMRCDFTPKGFHAMVFTTEGTVFVDPYSKGDITNYISYFKKDFIPPAGKYMPEYTADDTKIAKETPPLTGKIPSGTQLRTYRLALAADSNYYNFQGGTKPLTLAAMVTSMNRVNFVYEREVSIRMVLIAGNDQIIFPGNTSPYPYASTGACALRPENQAIIDSKIGSGNYDIGHLFAMSAGGCATGNSVCNNSTKAYGVTGTGNPVGDPFDIDYVAHEIGHQFNGSHTWNGTLGSCSPGQYVSSAAYEPGSGSTIMAYAGICGSDDLQPNSNAYFHTYSFDQIVAYSTTSTGNNCPTTTNTGNNIPTVNAGANYTIPISTPFILTGSGNDPDGDALSFCWEEFDLGPAGPPNVSTTTGPIFRSFNPVNIPSRTFPKLSDILNNVSTKGEILPSIGRTMTFRLTARDNRAGGGGVNYESMTLTVDGSKGPFAVTSPNSAVNWCPGPQTITWSVNGSDALAANVNILLSTDGGQTFPVTLAANTANDGSQVVNMPCSKSTMARIKIEAVGNVFFDISNANFTVGDNTKPTFTAPPNIIIYKDENCNYAAGPEITGDVLDEADNCSSGLNATYSDATAPGSCDGETILTRTWSLTDGCSNTTTKQQTITIRDNTPPTFTDPADITIYKDNNCNHDASVSVTGDVTDEDDNCDNTLDAVYSDVTVPGSCIGEEIITRTWSLTDDCGNSTSKTQVITVKDTTRPVIANISADPALLWPPNHTMRDVTIHYTAVDNCSPVTNSLSVSSNEPVNGTGDGNTAPDWVVIDDHRLQLRAERAGNGNGRIYTITITSTDDCGNVATANTVVFVPHDNKDVLVAKGTTEPAAEILNDLSVKAYPNPASRNFNVTVNGGKEERVWISIFDMYGRRIETRQLNKNATISLGQNYQAGTYILKATSGTQSREIKLTKIN